jgi:hypothetical protein
MFTDNQITAARNIIALHLGTQTALDLSDEGIKAIVRVCAIPDMARRPLVEHIDQFVKDNWK